jgi:hypothetical protein
MCGLDPGRAGSPADAASVEPAQPRAAVWEQLAKPDVLLLAIGSTVVRTPARGASARNPHRPGG